MLLCFEGYKRWWSSMFSDDWMILEYVNNPTVQWRSYIVLIFLLSWFTYLLHQRQHLPICPEVLHCSQTLQNPCCMAYYYPIKLSWTTTVYKFQDFEAGFRKYDTGNCIIADISDLQWEMLKYSAISIMVRYLYQEFLRTKLQTIQPIKSAAVMTGNWLVMED